MIGNPDTDTIAEIAGSNIDSIKYLDLPHKYPITFIKNGVEYGWLEPSEFPTEMQEFAYKLQIEHAKSLHLAGKGDLEFILHSREILLKYPMDNNITGSMVFFKSN